MIALKTILIVDDDQSISTSLRLLLEGEGYSVLNAKHGQEALDILETDSMSTIGLILLDFSMPVMDGPTFLLALQKDHPEILVDIPIFIITAGTAIHHVTIKNTGFLKKPFDVDKLLAVVTRYCGEPTGCAPSNRYG